MCKNVKTDTRDNNLCMKIHSPAYEYKEHKTADNVRTFVPRHQ